MYNRYYTEHAKLSKQTDQVNQQFDGQDPLQLASHFFALLKMTEIMVEEFKTEFPQEYEKDVNSKVALRSGFRAYKSENLDYFLEHHDQYPLTIVLFYDSEQMWDNVMRSLAVKILDVFVYKYDKKLAKGNFNFKVSKDDKLVDGVNQSTFD